MRTLLAGAAVVVALCGQLKAQSIPIPNGSFESPTPPPGFPATPQVDVWQKSPQPPGVPLPGGITWDQLSGVFPNTPAGALDHIDNVEGNQAAYMFTIPGVALFQQLNATFAVGNAYNLTVGILGGGGIAEGSSFLISLFFLDSANKQVTVGSTAITYSTADFANPTHLYDYHVTLAEVQAGSAWAGQNIGVELLSQAGTGAGYWDLDNVRLAAVPEPTTLGLLAVGLGGLLVARLRLRRRR